MSWNRRLRKNTPVFAHLRASGASILIGLASIAVIGILTGYVFPFTCQASAATGRYGMVASIDEYASSAGVDVLKKGGNAVDAAVAVHMVLAVTHPQAGNLGGGGFMVIHMEGGGEEADINTSIDFREKAPLASHRDMYLDNAGEVIPDASTLGYLACGVPGSVAGLWAVHQKYGTLPWGELLEPAYRLAKEGFVVSALLARDLFDTHDKLIQFPATAAIFTRARRSANGTDGVSGESAGHMAFREGDVLVQKDLAWTIKKVMEEGRDGFYKGEVAALVAADMRANGGLITEEDLAIYRPIEREPIICGFAGYTVVSMPPPSSGGVLLCQVLAMLSDFNLKGLGLNSSAYIHLLTEVEKLAYADRAEFLGDSDFYPVPVDHLLSPDYIAPRARGIDLERATPSEKISHGPWPEGETKQIIGETRGSPPVREDAREGEVDNGGNAKDQHGDNMENRANRKAQEDRDHRESPETTHFSIVDRYGNAVSCTTTLNGRFGSCVVAAGTGVLLNNEMDDFSMKPGVPNIYGLVGGEANAIAPEKRMLSSMTPTIVLEGSTPEVGGDGAPKGDEVPRADDNSSSRAHAERAPEGERVKLVLGSPGGSTIITTVLQVILNVLLHEMPLEEAVGTPRFHHQWLPDETRVESAGIPQDVLDNLEKMGHNIQEVDYLGDVHAVSVQYGTHHPRADEVVAAAVQRGSTSTNASEEDAGEPDTTESVAGRPIGKASGEVEGTPADTPQLFTGVSDPRRGGIAIGY